MSKYERSKEIWNKLPAGESVTTGSLSGQTGEERKHIAAMLGNLVNRGFAERIKVEGKKTYKKLDTINAQQALVQAARTRSSSTRSRRIPKLEIGHDDGSSEFIVNLIRNKIWPELSEGRSITAHTIYRSHFGQRPMLETLQIIESSLDALVRECKAKRCVRRGTHIKYEKLGSSDAPVTPAPLTPEGLPLMDLADQLQARLKAICDENSALKTELAELAAKNAALFAEIETARKILLQCLDNGKCKE